MYVSFVFITSSVDDIEPGAAKLNNSAPRCSQQKVWNTNDVWTNDLSVCLWVP